jgi:hypothetical protein
MPKRGRVIASRLPLRFQKNNFAASFHLASVYLKTKRCLPRFL